MESFEQPKQKYIYIDNSVLDEPHVVFECDASSIEEADQKYEEYTGKDPAKQPHIGCAIENS